MPPAERVAGFVLEGTMCSCVELAPHHPNLIGQIRLLSQKSPANRNNKPMTNQRRLNRRTIAFFTRTPHYMKVINEVRHMVCTSVGMVLYNRGSQSRLKLFMIHAGRGTQNHHEAVS